MRVRAASLTVIALAAHSIVGCSASNDNPSTATSATPAVRSASTTSGTIVGIGGLCVDVDAWGTANGTKVQLWSCNGGANQSFTYEAGQLVGVASGKCLDIAGDNQVSGTIVRLWSCNQTAAQQWSIDGVQIKSTKGFCLNATGASDAEGTQLQIATCANPVPSSQSWHYSGSVPPGDAGLDASHPPSDGSATGSDTGTDGASSGSSSGGSGSSSGSSSGGSGSSSGSSSGGSGSSSGSSSGGSDGGTTLKAGNPNGSCSAGVPAKGAPVDTSKPTTVVGTGTAASCTFSALEAAVTKGGIITFDCGSAPTTIAVTSTLNVPIDTNTVIDGGGTITLDGGGKVEILSFNSPNFQANENGLTLQHLTLSNGKMTPTEAIPVAPAPCSQGWNNGQGGALFMRDGNLTVIDCIFTNNQAALLGPDTGGGAIYMLGSLHGALIVNSTFTGNKASNGGAVGGLFSEFDVYNSLLTLNTATGNGANSDDPAECSAINAGQNQVGSGGNGGALSSDGNSVNIILCGDAIEDNAAGVNAFGGGVFFTSDNMQGTLTITDTTITGNTGGYWTSVSGGSVTNAGTAIGTNAKSITITNSTVQGVP